MPGSGGAQASSFCAKEHPPGIKLQKTSREREEHKEGESEAQGTGGRRMWSHHLGPEGDWAYGRGRQGGGGAGVRVVEAGKGRKGPLERITPGANRELGAGRVWQRGGNWKREGRHRLARGTNWAAQQGRKSETSGGVRQAGAPSRWTVAPRPVEMGGEKRVQREIEAVSTGERWGLIGDRSRRREKRNEPPREKGRRNCGKEGLDKSIIDKRQSLRIEQSLT